MRDIFHISGNMSSDKSKDSAADEEDGTSKMERVGVKGDSEELVGGVVKEEEVEEEEELIREHSVKDRETLNSIAAFYDTTPSALAQYNKMGSSRFIFPGKLLKIPPKEKPPPPPSPPPPPPSPPPQKKPVRHVVVGEEEIVERQFVKINVRHITDGKGVVFGSLLVTPKTVMFNPNHTDLLVMETDPDKYQIIAPAELVVNYAIFNDFYKFNSSFGIDVKEEVKGTLYSSNDKPADNEEDKDKEEDEDKEEDKESTIEEVEEDKNAEKNSNKENEEKSNNNSEGAEMSEEPISRQVSIEPMYLRMVMGKPIAKKLPRQAPIMSYGNQTLEPEYWFIIPEGRVPDLHSVVSHLFPAKYGLLDHVSIERTGYEVIRPGTALLEEADSGRTCNRESVSRLLSKTMTMTSLDYDLIAEMKGDSEVILADDRRSVARHLPAKTDGLNWELYYGTGRDGYSLQHLYKKMHTYDGPILIVIKAVSGSTFGAYLTRNEFAMRQIPWKHFCRKTLTALIA
jgi:LysM repeat protein